MEIAERQEAVRKCNLCFSCLGSGHRIGQCKANRTCGKDGCSKRHNILLHLRRNPTTQRKITTKMKLPTTRMQCSQRTRVVEVCKLFLSACPAGTRPLRQWFFVTPILRSFCWDKSVLDQLNAQGKALKLNIAGINGTQEMAGENVRINVTTLKVSESVVFHVRPSM